MALNLDKALIPHTDIPVALSRHKACSVGAYLCVQSALIHLHKRKQLLRMMMTKTPSLPLIPGRSTPSP